MIDQSFKNEVYTKLGWHPSRNKTFSEIILAAIKTGSITLKHRASHVSSRGGLKAKIEKVERLLHHQDFDFVAIGKLIFQILEEIVVLLCLLTSSNNK